MQNRSMSDLIEAYLKQVLQERTDIEIRRAEIAQLFQCVPSQINYVINTRFTTKQGYLVESKRGGGGYIRIIKLDVIDEAGYIDKMIQLIGNGISLRDAVAIINNLQAKKIISEKEAILLNGAVDKELTSQFQDAARARSVILSHLLEHIKFR